jgi:hypothetical protein
MAEAREILEADLMASSQPPGTPVAGNG